MSERQVVVAPTAFKGTLGPMSVARAIAAGVREEWPGAAIIQRPLSDGGNGLVESYAALAGGRIEEREVTGPLGEPVRARYLSLEDTAVVESAEACGLHLIPPERRDPLRTTTRGVGELLAAAARAGASRLVLGLGGSGTVDGGTGMARALGWRFLDDRGRPLAEGGGSLVELAGIEPPGERLAADVVALCDVKNPLLGVMGGARVYGPQKGASEAEVERLEAGLARLAQVIESVLGVSVADLPGAGAAGGLGAGARAFLGAELAEGAEWMIERAGLVELMEGADLVVTGEGRYDAQSGMGKVTGRVVAGARGAGVPVLVVCGSAEGPPPPGVEVAAGGGRTLGEAEIAALVRDACRALVAEDRL